MQADRIYIHRPACFENMSFAKFTAYYTEGKASKTNLKSAMLMLRRESEEHKTTTKNSKAAAVAKKRKRFFGSYLDKNQTTHFVAPYRRGPANESSPLFAAGALIMHMPFRSISELLKGKTIVERLQDCLSNSHQYPEVANYVEKAFNVIKSRESIMAYRAKEKEEKDEKDEKDNALLGVKMTMMHLILAMQIIALLLMMAYLMALTRATMQSKSKKLQQSKRNGLIIKLKIPIGSYRLMFLTHM